MPGRDRHAPDPAPAPTTRETFRRSRREAGWILLTWVVFAVWVLAWGAAASGPAGGGEPSPVETTFGFPSWVFWGIALPWAAAALFSILFALVVMRDHPLDDADDADPGASPPPGGGGEARSADTPTATG